MDLWQQVGAYLALVGIFSLTGAASGVAAGLFGIGGGTITVPLLSTAFTAFGLSTGEGMHIAIATSLAAIIPTSVMSFRNHARLGTIDIDMLKRLAPFLILGGIAGGALAGHVNARLLGALFAATCIFIAARFWISQHSDEEEVLTASLALQRVLGFAIGTISSMIGIGGGIFGVMLMRWMHLPIHRAIATASGFSFLVVVPGTLMHMLGPAPDTYVPFGTVGMIHPVALFLLVPSSMLAVPFGVRLAHRLPALALQRCFAGVLTVLGLKMLYSSIS